jgi:hypothetical protein
MKYGTPRVSTDGQSFERSLGVAGRDRAELEGECDREFGLDALRVRFMALKSTYGLATACRDFAVRKAITSARAFMTALCPDSPERPTITNPGGRESQETGLRLRVPPLSSTVPRRRNEPEGTVGLLSVGPKPRTRFGTRRRRTYC